MRGAPPPGRWRARARVALALAVVTTLAGVVGISASKGATQASTGTVGSGFTVTAGDLSFILKQIKIAERHAATLTPANPCGTLVGPGPDQIPDPLTSYGLRTVDGSCNNLIPGRETFAAADVPFPRLTPPLFRDAEVTPAAFGPPTPTSYKQKTAGNVVFDSQPRVISNLIVDQTSTNPAAVAAAGFPVRTQGNTGLVPCTTDPDPTATPPVVGVPAGCTPSHKTLFIPNVTTDVGLSPPYSSLFTFFGQFFDHGVDQTVKSGGTVFVPLHADDPLVTLGPDGKPNTGDEVPPSQAFMVLTRAQNQPGPDGILGTDDDVQNANNTDTPWVDQSQTYTSHASHQIFLREYVLNNAGRPVSTGKLLGGLAAGQTYAGSPDGQTGMATWASVKRQAATLLGLQLQDKDVTNIPMLAADPYGKFIPGPARGLPQYVTETGLVEGNTAGGGVPVPANVRHFDTPFLTDIAHNADPSPQDTDHNPATPPVAPVPDADNTPSADFANQPVGTYDDEMLNAHFCAGDGRVNENIALTTIHQIFHSEHDRLIDDIKNTLSTDTSTEGVAALAQWKLAAGAAGWNGERLFQAARFVTEMEYQHLVFEEFARKIQPAIRPFHLYHSDINAAIPAEFAHAVYRFGHSMLDDDVARTTKDANGNTVDHSIPLLTAFLNPPEYFNSGTAATPFTPEQAAGAVVMGSVDQVGNELDEFVTETLRNNLLGLPLDLPTINMTRARSEGVPPLNVLRRQIFAATNDGQLTPYTSWADFGQHLKHPESLINFVAAYGTHPSITSQSTLAGKRAAATLLVNPPVGTNPADIPADATSFMQSTDAWSNKADGATTTGLDEVDLWVGGLAEVTNLFGGLLGTTFNYVFQSTLENLQDGDRLYYLARTPGMNLRTQLEGNSFSELIMRNTDGTNSLKADPFGTADCKFQLAHLDGTPAGYLANGATVADDLTTPDCNETELLLRKPDGTIQYKAINSVDPPGINGQSVYNGTDGVDRIFGGNDNDTFWGGLGNDIIEGNGGDDVILGGLGNDIETDLGGADVLKGGPGNDALDGGIGDDIFMGGEGSDVILGGANDNETFAGPGNDFINAGQGTDTAMGDGGDDWIQGGSGQDLLIGDHSAPFFDDPAETRPGNDIFVGQVGENDYDAEGGDDMMAQNSAIDRNAGAGGFDWAFHQYNTTAAVDDMMINNNLGALPIQVVVNRDRWQETEADSGSQFDDSIKGTDGVLATPRLITGGGFTGCDAIDEKGLARISGLAAILPPIATWVGTATETAALSASRFCPLGLAVGATTDKVWGEGDILLGGAGSDTIEGRAGNEIIDGDRELRVRISVRTNPADPATEIGTTDLLEHQYLKDGAGNPTGPTLQSAVFAGTVDPGNLVMVREIITPAVSVLDTDTAVFSGPLADYDITRAGGVVTVAHVRGAATDGTDTLRNIERLKFADQTVSALPPPAAPAVTTNPTATAGVAFASQNVTTTSAPRAVTVTNSGNAPLTITSLNVAGPNFAIASNTCLAGSIAAGGTCTVNVTFSPQTTGTLSSSLVIASNAPAGSVTIGLTGTGTAAPAPAAFIFGSQAIQPKLDSNTAGLAEAFKTTSGSSGSVTQLRVFVDTGSVGSVVAALYTNTAAGHPGTLLTSGSVATPVIGQFNTITVPAVSVTAGQTYWIAVLGPTGTFHFRDRGAVGAGNSETSVQANLATMPANWTTGSSFSDGTLSAFAAGTVTAAPPPAPGLAVLVGNNNTEVKVDNDTAGQAEAFKTTAATTGSVSRLRIFLDASSTAGSVVLGLYSNNAGHPGTLLTTGTITAPTAGVQNEVAVTATNVTAGTTYWIAVLGRAGTVAFRDRGAVGAGNAETSSATTLTALPTTWVTGGTFADGLLSAVGLG